MRLVNKVIALLLVSVLCVSSSAWAQQAHIVNSSTMRQAVAEKGKKDSADRELLLRVLNRADARDLASAMGLTVGRAESAVAALDGTELRLLAHHAETIEASLAGGANVITLSVTTLLLLLILIVLIVN